MPKPKPPKKSPGQKRLPAAALHGLLAMGFAIAVTGLFLFCRHYVESRRAEGNRPPHLVLVNRPDWMSDFLADQILHCALPPLYMGDHSTFDRQLLADVAGDLQANPWVRQVNQVRRVYGNQPGDTIEIDCDYRIPTALVEWKNTYWLSDGLGVKLPEEYTTAQLPRIMFDKENKVVEQLIVGVNHAPPQSGRVWAGDDLAAGLELARLLYAQPWAQDIRKIDVSNYAGRQNAGAAQIVLVTQYGTQIRWGRSPSARDAFVEIPASNKIAAIETLYERTHRADGNLAWLDVRFDPVTGPQTPAAASATAQDR